MRSGNFSNVRVNVLQSEDFIQVVWRQILYIKLSPNCVLACDTYESRITWILNWTEAECRSNN